MLDKMLDINKLKNAVKKFAKMRNGINLMREICPRSKRLSRTSFATKKITLERSVLRKA